MKRLIFLAVIAISAGFFGSQLSQAAALPPAPSVLVLPFTPAENAGANDWIGKGIQQSLLADLSGTPGVAVTFSTAQPGQAAHQPADSLAVAAQAGASVAVVGTYQTVDNQIRITGVVYDVASGKDLGGIKVTGPMTDLFKLEDALNDQVLRVLPINHAPVNVPAAPQQPAAPVNLTSDDSSSVLPNSVVVTTPQSSQTVYVYPNTSYSYPVYYPYYSAPCYSYIGFSPFVRCPVFCRPVVFSSGFRGGVFVGFHGGFGGGFHGGFGGGFHGGGRR